MVYVLYFLCGHSHHVLQSLNHPGIVANAPCGQLTGKRICFSLSPFAPENVVSRGDRFERPRPASARSLSTQAEYDDLMLINTNTNTNAHGFLLPPALLYTLYTRYYRFIFIFYFFYLTIIADGPHHYHPACGHH